MKESLKALFHFLCLDSSHISPELPTQIHASLEPVITLKQYVGIE